MTNFYFPGDFVILLNIPAKKKKKHSSPSFGRHPAWPALPHHDALHPIRGGGGSRDSSSPPVAISSQPHDEGRIKSC